MGPEIETLELTLHGARDACSIGVVTHRRAGRGTALLCLHGFGDNHRTWQALTETPALRERPLLALDLPGFGASPLAPAFGAHYASNCIELVRALARTSFATPPVLIGSSMGGSIALGTLIRSALERDVTNAVGAVLLSPATPGTRTPPFLRLLRARGFGVLDELGRRLGEARRLQLARVALRPVLQMMHGPGIRPEPRWARSVSAALARPGALLDLEVVAREVRAILAGEVPEIAELHGRVEAVRAPVAVARGEFDRVVSGSELRDLAARLPEGSYVELAGVGHLPHMEDAPQAARLVIDVLQRAGAAGPDRAS
jgi:pimeloyl-ACP methyl ester carboxylesterase